MHDSNHPGASQPSENNSLSGIWARLDRIAPLEVWILAVIGIFYHFLAQRPYNIIWGPEFTYDQQMRWLLPIAFGLAMVYSYVNRFGMLKLGRYSFQTVALAEVALGISAVLYIVFIDPIIYVDDVGFILRYLDNFRDGCFYCYNVEDGPVFGISSFIYGLLAGIISMLHLMGPETTINFLTYVGVFAFVVLLFRIMRQMIASPGLVVLLVILAITGNKSVVSIFNSGMESPVHLSIMLAGMLFYLKRNFRLMWLFLALATISKLDVVPLVLVVGVLWLIENAKELMPLSWNNRLWRDLVMYGVVPVVIWIVFALLVFGSPLPQSAYAKVYFHNHAKGSWFPFLDHFINSAYRAPMFWTMMVIFLMQVGSVVAERRRPSEIAFGLAFVATMLLYYFYNPGERMQWYYTLPETLMLIQLAVSVHWLFLRLRKLPRTLVLGLLLGGTFMLSWTRQIVEVQDLRNYEYVVEIERKHIGEYLGATVADHDTLMAGHGLNARQVKGYVIDQTGLNSKITTNFQRNVDSILDVLKPNYTVAHGFPWELERMNKHFYVPDTAFYDITGYWYPTWRVFRRVDTWAESAGLYRLKKKQIQGGNLQYFEEMHHFHRVTADNFKFTRQHFNNRELYMSLGVFRQEEDFTIRIRDILPGRNVVRDYEVTIKKKQGRGSSITESLTVPLRLRPAPDSVGNGARFIRFDFEGNAHPVQITDPVVAISRSD